MKDVLVFVDAHSIEYETYIAGHTVTVCFDFDGDVNFEVNGLVHAAGELTPSQGACVLRFVRKCIPEAVTHPKFPSHIDTLYCCPVSNDDRAELRVRFIRSLGFKPSADGEGTWELPLAELSL